MWSALWRLARRASTNGRRTVDHADGAEQLELALARVRSRAQGDPLEVRARVAESTNHAMIFRLGWLDGDRVLADGNERRRP